MALCARCRDALGMTGRRAVLALVAVLVLVAAYAMLRSPAFRVTTVTVAGLSQLSAQRIASEAAVAAGTPLWRVSRGTVAARVLADPMVSSVQVVKQWPDHLRILIHERVAVAAVVLPDQRVAQVDASGVVMRVSQGLAGGLPLVTGSREPLSPGNQVQTRGLSRAVAVAAALGKFPALDVSEVHVQPDATILLYLAGGTPVDLGGAQDPERQLSVLAGLLETTKEQRLTPVYINLVDPSEPVVKPAAPVPSETAPSS